MIVAFKRLLRPLVKVPQNDLWERQRVFNLILLEHLAQHREKLDELDARVRNLETFMKEGLDEVMRYNDALYSRLDQKADRYRREARELLSQLQAAVARAGVRKEEDGEPLRQMVAESAYRRLEDRFRGTEEEIAQRVERYSGWLEGREKVLDLGCGRGEALRVMKEMGVGATGVDSSAEMVRRCREQGLEAHEADVVRFLAACVEESHDAIVSFHVIEHLEPATLERLIRLAWRALEPGGVLILETPSPLSLRAAAERFWIDPTHQRPVHPASLRLALEEAGFEQVERLDLNPFPDADRLSEIDLASFEGAEAKRLADRVNRLRDQLDGLLLGYQDYAVIATKGSRNQEPAGS